ncbi:glycosyltransferase family 4 protein [Conexibacter sp. DBS9H8]|uniref:glycosyltransferase family 4 protein n=1 Tax=Conexibacter sp. DBS9H8 TaxID=2937801 RepID=UPI00200FDAE1|nr:glycosyltransferase family 4 protein [Conexibacter sp. DBS9H8]
MRVLAIGSVYPPHLLGGYEVIWQGVSDALAAAGHTGRVLVSDYANPAVVEVDPPGGSVHRELRWYWHDHRWPRHRLAERVAIERHNAAVLAAHLQAFAPDVVAFWPMGGMSLTLITRVRRARLPAVFFLLDPWPIYGPVHDQWLAPWRPRGGPADRVRAAAAALTERATGLCTELDLRGRWVFGSEWMAAHAGLPAATDDRSGVVLRPGVEQRYLSAGAKPAGPWSGRLLYLGRVVEQKGVGTAIDALARLPAETTLTVIGSADPVYRATLESRADGLGVTDRVHFRPACSRAETVAAYAAADAVLFPVLWEEPWGLVPLEAMAVGRPVIATRRGGSGEFLRTGVNCLSHRPGDADGLAAAVTALAADPALRERLVRGGRETAETHSAAAFNQAAVAELVRTARSQVPPG